jgi:hypothetical protein
MTCSIKSPVQRRFVIRCWVGALFVVLLTAVAALLVRLAHVHGPMAYPVAVLPALPIIWVLYETGRYLALETDEFQRNQLVQCLLGGIGGTLSLTTVWGNLEHFAHIPQLDPLLIYAIFWFFAAITYPVVYWRYR